MPRGAKLPKVSPKVSTTDSAPAMPAASMANQPASASIQVASDATSRQSTGPQLICHAVDAGPASACVNRKSLLLREQLRPFLSHLAHDGSGKQLQVGTVGNHALPVDGVHQPSALRHGHPTPRRHIKRPAGLQGARGKLSLQFGGGQTPVRGRRWKTRFLNSI